MTALEIRTLPLVFRHFVYCFFWRKIIFASVVFFQSYTGGCDSKIKWFFLLRVAGLYILFVCLSKRYLSSGSGQGHYRNSEWHLQSLILKSRCCVRCEEASFKKFFKSLRGHQRGDVYSVTLIGRVTLGVGG